jgi:hypothetical protein
VERDSIDFTALFRAEKITQTESAIATLTRKRESNSFLTLEFSFMVQNDEVVSFAITREIPVDNGGV